MGTPINPNDLQFTTREYYLGGGTDYANGQTLSFEQLDTTLIFLSNSIATAGTSFVGLTTASANLNTINFSKSNGTTFSITVDTGSGALNSANFTASFNNQSTWTINHNLDYKYVLVQIFDSNDNQIIPEEITLVNSNTAQATFNSGVSGKAVVTVGGTTLDTTLPAGSDTQIQYNNGGAFGASSNLTFNGTDFRVYNPSSTFISFRNIDNYYNTSQVLHVNDLNQDYVDQFTSTGYLKQVGDRFQSNVWAISASPYDVAYLESTSTWYPVDQADAYTATRLLGIVTGDSEVITEGYVTVADNNYAPNDAVLVAGTLTTGAPVYLKEGASSAPFLSTVVPTNTGGVARIVGHLLYQNADDNNNYWLMRFRPDHTWVEIV